jgi:hypothetical protein
LVTGDVISIAATYDVDHAFTWIAFTRWLLALARLPPLLESAARPSSRVDLTMAPAAGGLVGLRTALNLEPALMPTVWRERGFSLPSRTLGLDCSGPALTFANA